MATKPRTKRAPKGGEPALEKENIDVSPVLTKGPVKKNTTPSLEEELEAMTKALQQVSLEKQQNETKLREKDEQLSAQAAEAERIQNLLKSSDEQKKRLEEKLRKLQKAQGFQPTLVSLALHSYFLFIE
jgi:chromosome segregation ATPase